MNTERLLIPIDLDRCSVDVIEVVNNRAQQPGVTVILAHVLKLNIVSPDNDLYDQIGREAFWYLGQLARQCFSPMAQYTKRVCAGKPADQIIALARVEQADTIILPNYGPSFWSRLRAICRPGTDPMLSRLAERILREATCGVMLVSSRSSFSCEETWGPPPRQTAPGANWLPSAPSVSFLGKS